MVGDIGESMCSPVTNFNKGAALISAVNTTFCLGQVFIIEFHHCSRNHRQPLVSNADKPKKDQYPVIKTR